MKLYPTKHLSIRVPWHDNGWKGTICNQPEFNNSCLILKRIADTINDLKEEKNAGQTIENLGSKDWPACIIERGTFMADFAYTRIINHPYAKSSKDTHGHFKPTPFFVPKYTAPAVPFRWMLKDNFNEYQKEFVLDMDEAWEPKLKFKSAWTQAYENQKELLDCFFDHVEEDKSLCFFYAKRVPFTEKSGRVIVGIGRVKNVGNAIEYDYSKKGSLRGLIWERNIEHTITPDFEDGFLLPYAEAYKYSEENPESDLNPEDLIVFAPEGRRLEFSYATEHVSQDGAIETLLSCTKSLEKINEYLPGPWNKCIRWIDTRLGELWEMRGPCPGLGAALYAFGIDLGNFVANCVTEQLETDEDPWDRVEKVFKSPESLLPPMIAKQIGKNHQKLWEKLKDERKNLLKLLSRFDISPEQALLLYDKDLRNEFGLKCTDKEILENPYLIYELTRHTVYPVSFKTVDHGLLPDHNIQNKFPLPEPSNIDNGVDERRVRALIVDILEKAANEGNTLLPQTEIIKLIREETLEPPCNLNSDLLEVIEEYFKDVIENEEMKDSSRAYQLSYLSKMGDKIRNIIKKRSIANRLDINADWKPLLDQKLGPNNETNEEEKLREEKARKEKVAALKELANSRISVLIGPAGTGKTTLLSVLAAQKDIQNGGLLLLAPTGKARVKLEQSIGNPNQKAYTIAQYLNMIGGYDGDTRRYVLPKKSPQYSSKTVIIDESSMLTEEMLGAVLASLKGVERLILVGDHRQLPPIGAGRPFVDIIEFLKPDTFEDPEIKVGNCYAHLQIIRRQDGANRPDLLLAKWFSGEELEPGEDEIFESVMNSDNLSHIRFIDWKDPEELPEILMNTLVEELPEIENLEDYEGFNKSLGAYKNARGYNEYSANGVEDWQIISPVKNWPYGVLELNRLIHKTFRGGLINYNKRNWKPLNPLGAEELIIGDKVINVLNHSRKYYNPFIRRKEKGYLANGEIGIAISSYNYGLNIEFSSQPGINYGFPKYEFGEESTTLIELAYALTIHKAQGSEFEKVFLILPDHWRMLSRELLYTALTRQTKKVIILHQGPFIEFKKYSDDIHSVTARRYTNIFYKPSVIEFEDKFLEERLINVTKRGEAVRSKSEVIIADLLDSNEVDYAYEEKLIIDGIVKYPDFTIHDDDLGIKYYWEHCGMMQDPNYRKRWMKKLRWYKNNDILPLEQGGGKNGTLIITEDNDKGGISSKDIDRLIKDHIID